MFADEVQLHELADGHRQPQSTGRDELICLLRLHEIALADPPPVDGLRAMVDEIVRLPHTFRAVVAVPEVVDARLRYLAHVGIIGMKPHQPALREPTPMAAKAMATGELVQLVRSDGGPPHGCINLPITGGDRALGFFGLGMRVPVPLEPWREEMVWAMADLMALMLLKRRSRRPATKSSNGSSLKGLTPRQREVLFELVERSGGNSEIGKRFGLSARTVKIHLMAAYRQLGVHTRAEAIRLVLTKHGDWLAQERASRRGRSGSG